MSATKDTYTELSDIVEIRELNAIQDVNLHIRQGWKILDTYKSAGLNNEEVLTYCMGKPDTQAQQIAAEETQSVVKTRATVRRNQSSRKKNSIYTIL